MHASIIMKVADNLERFGVKESMALKWLRRSKQKESKPKPKSKNDSLNEQLEALKLEVTNSKREIAEFVKKSEEYERTILRLRKESFELQNQNENLTNEKEVLKKTIKALEQRLATLGANAWDLVQPGGQPFPLPQPTMIADGETVCLVAHAL